MTVIAVTFHIPAAKVKDGITVKKAVAEMEEVVQSVGAAMYQQQSAQEQSPADKTDGKKDTKEAVEGDFEEVKAEGTEQDQTKEKKDK